MVFSGAHRLLASASVPRALAGPERALLDGRADVAAASLKAALAADPTNGPAHLLLCRVWLSEEFANQAVAECRAALANGLAQDSAAQDWTGRALGMQAEHAGMIAGFKLALQVKGAFEAAVSLDPNSQAACVDLGEYYTSAPAVVGGGSARALAFSSRLEHTLPEVAHRIRAMAAEKSDDFPTAEREFQAEVAVGHTPGALVDLTTFYDRHHNAAKAIATAREAIAADHTLDANVIDAASVLKDQQETRIAEDTLRSYLTHGARSDAAPAFRVYTLLGSILARSGDKPGARSQFQQALALASGYAPAQKALAAL